MSFNRMPGRAFCLTLILLLTAAVFSACGESEDEGPAENANANAAASPSAASTAAIDVKSLSNVNSDTYLAVDGISGQPAKPDTPVVINSKTTPSFAITGWAADQRAQREAGGVIINVDGNKDILAKYGEPRPDVAANFKDTKYTNTGFVANMDAVALGKGRHTLTIRVVTVDRKGYFEHKNKFAVEIQ